MPEGEAAIVCEHLAELEQALIAAGVAETFRGQSWSSNCWEWVYFACWLDRPAIRSRFVFAGCVEDHDHRGTHDGQEAGFVCSLCHDAIMGVHASHRSGLRSFPNRKLFVTGQLDTGPAGSSSQYAFVAIILSHNYI